MQKPIVGPELLEALEAGAGLLQNESRRLLAVADLHDDDDYTGRAEVVSSQAALLRDHLAALEAGVTEVHRAYSLLNGMDTEDRIIILAGKRKREDAKGAGRMANDDMQVETDPGEPGHRCSGMHPIVHLSPESRFVGKWWGEVSGEEAGTGNCASIVGVEDGSEWIGPDGERLVVVTSFERNRTVHLRDARSPVGEGYFFVFANNFLDCCEPACWR